LPVRKAMHTQYGVTQLRIVPPLDPDFRPAILRMRGGKGVHVEVAFERSVDSISRAVAVIPHFAALERWLKFLLWSRGAHRIHFAGPREWCDQLRRHYAESATGRFDADIMGRKIYERPFEIVWSNELPAAREQSAPLGGHLKGCRIGFDLGASDRKVAAVIDGESVFTEEVPWDPRSQSDPQWHFDQINDSLKRAAEHLPRVDAIGGSAAGVYVNNQVKVASLFRGVPEDLFAKRVKGLFSELKRAWNDVPFEVVNDGEVTALAGAMALKTNGVLGISMGSSQAAGYVTPDGKITSWLNELAFAPIDYNPSGPVDEWSGDYGCGVQYFSQQGVGRLIPKAGLPLRDDLPLPEKLVEVQKAMAAGDERACRIYETIGICFGYAVAHYAQFYDFKHLLILGRVTTGHGGAVIIREAQRVLSAEFPHLEIAFHIPDEKEKRHGQAIAAASLPVI